MAWAVATCLFWAAVLSISFPAIQQVMTTPGAFGFYAGLNILAFVLIFLWLPETKQRTLEELDYVFAVPTTRHMSYQCGTWAPWFVKRYVLWRKDAYLEPLYQFEGGLAADQQKSASVEALRRSSTAQAFNL